MGQPQYPFDKPRWQRVPKTADAIKTMHREQMLPAIFFIFSRVACDENAARLAADDSLCLTSPEEQMLIKAEVDKLRSGLGHQPEPCGCCCAAHISGL